MNPNIYHTLHEYKRAVVIFSHTSYIDFVILVIYFFAYPQYFARVFTLVKPQPFLYTGYMLRHYRCIAATSVANKNGGSIQTIIDRLKYEPEWCFLLSPKGTILNRPWRSGYYHIAKELNATLMVTGFDYETKEIVLRGIVSPDDEEPIVRNNLEIELKEIVPLFPEGEVVTIRPHDSSKRNIISSTRLTIIISSIILGLSYTFF